MVYPPEIGPKISCLVQHCCQLSWDAEAASGASSSLNTEHALGRCKATVAMNRHRQTTPVAVEEEALPRRRNREHGGAGERAAIYEEVEEAVEMDKQRYRQSLKKMLFFVIFALVVSAIGEPCPDAMRPRRPPGRKTMRGLREALLIVVR